MQPDPGSVPPWHLPNWRPSGRYLASLIAVAIMFAFAAETIAAPSRFGLIDDPARPTADWCGDRKLGTWFYCSKPRPADQAAPPASPPQSATQRLDAITEKMK